MDSIRPSSRLDVFSMLVGRGVFRTASAAARIDEDIEKNSRLAVMRFLVREITSRESRNLDVGVFSSDVE